MSDGSLTQFKMEHVYKAGYPGIPKFNGGGGVKSVRFNVGEFKCVRFNGRRSNGTGLNCNICKSQKIALFIANRYFSLTKVGLNAFSTFR